MKTAILISILLAATASYASYDERDVSPFERTTYSLECKSADQQKAMSFYKSDTEYFDAYDQGRSTKESSFGLELGVLKLKGSDESKVSGDLVTYTNPVTNREAKVLKFAAEIEKEGLKVGIEVFNDGVANEYKTYTDALKNEETLEVFGTAVVFSGENKVIETELSCTLFYEFEEYY